MRWSRIATPRVRLLNAQTLWRCLKAILAGLRRVPWLALRSDVSQVVASYRDLWTYIPVQLPELWVHKIVRRVLVSNCLPTQYITSGFYPISLGIRDCSLSPALRLTCLRIKEHPGCVITHPHSRLRLDDFLRLGLQAYSQCYRSAWPHVSCTILTC